MTLQKPARGSGNLFLLQDAEPVPVRSATAVEAVLAAVLKMQKAADLRGVADCAAAALLHLTEGSAAAAYVDPGHGELCFAAAGEFSSEHPQARAEALLKLAAEGNDAALVIAGEPGTCAAPFQAEGVRGAVLAERPAMPFREAERAAIVDFARLAGAAAASVVKAGRSQAWQRREAGVLDGVSVGVLVVAEGKASLLNHAGAQLLGVEPAQIVGRSLDSFWPELMRAMKPGQAIDRETLRVRDRFVTVSLRATSDGDPAAGAVVTLEAGSPPPSDPPRPCTSDFSSLVGVSSAIASVRDVARVAAQSSSGVLIEGESGAGKEVVAQAIHAAGPRRKQPFIAVLCAAIPRELLESELFGYEPGAFTGASPKGRAGKFELAHGGTLLLDDIVDMPQDMQAKLLRVLQEREVTRVGGSRPRPVDVRIIATSNRTILEAVRGGLFRADLYYRLNVLHMSIPPLRQRREDIKPLAEHFLRKHASAHGSRLTTIGAEALRSLQAHSWPGNVRELEHWMESEIHFVPAEETCLRRLSRQPEASQPEEPEGVRTLRDLERQLYAKAIAQAAGDISRAARDLGISRGKLYRKLRLYELLPRGA